MSGNGKSAHRGFHGLFSRLGIHSIRLLFLFWFLNWRRGGVVETQSLGILLTDLKMSQRGPHGVTLTNHHTDFTNHARARGGDAHDGLVCLHLEEVCIGLHAVTRSKYRADNRRLGNGFAELWHDDREEGHGSRSLG